VTAPDAILQLGVDASSALGTVRLSLGVTTTADDVVRAAGALASAWKRLESGA
jgi:cysteine sulfinate desulfinase/cysteine desulfurase-like protein